MQKESRILEQKETSASAKDTNSSIQEVFKELTEFRKGNQRGHDYVNSEKFEKVVSELILSCENKRIIQMNTIGLINRNNQSGPCLSADEQKVAAPYYMTN